MRCLSLLCFTLSCSGALSPSGGVGGANGPGPQSMNPASPMGPGSPLPDDSVDRGPGGGPIATPSTCVTGPVAARVWRLKSEQYERTLNALLPNANPGAPVLGEDSTAGGFSTNSSTLQMTPQSTTQLVSSTEGFAKALVAKPQLLAPCLTKAAGFDDVNCVKTMVTEFGQRAFRRPLEVAEVDRYTALYSAQKAQFQGAAAVALVVRALLQSPHFLFRTELGNGTAGSELTAYEKASLIAYSVSDAPPDAALLAAAQAQTLSAAKDIEMQVRRLLASQNGEAVLGRFGVEWLGLSAVESAVKDPTRFKTFSPDVALAMRTELAQFVTETTFRGDGSFDSLMTSPLAFVPKLLAPFYGLSSVTSATPQKVTLSASERSGLLTRAAVATVFATDTSTEPVHRGQMIRNEMLCNGLLVLGPQRVSQRLQHGQVARGAERWQPRHSRGAGGICGRRCPGATNALTLSLFSAHKDSCS